MKRSDLKALLKSRGARVVSKLTAATTLLILGTLTDHATQVVHKLCVVFANIFERMSNVEICGFC